MSAQRLAGAEPLRGRLSESSLPQVLNRLRENPRTGLLNVVNEGVRKSIYVLDGRLVFAASSASQDRLGEVLLRGGRITPDEYLQLSRRIRGGQRLGKALIEGRVLAPRDLWWAIEQQIREIIFSLFEWDEGYYHFEEDDLPRREKITFDLDLEELVIEGIRRSDGSGTALGARLGMDSLLKRSEREPSVTLEPHETHVLELVDGKRTVAEICQESEIGEAETVKVLYCFSSVGVLESLGRQKPPLDQELTDGEDFASVVELYNEMYRRLFRHMSDEVGPIAEIILEKYLKELKERPGSLFERVRLGPDGSLDAAQIERNVRGLSEGQRRDQLISSLNELLYSELLAVKRTLGASHESQLIQLFREMRGEA